MITDRIGLHSVLFPLQIRLSDIKCILHWKNTIPEWLVTKITQTECPITSVGSCFYGSFLMGSSVINLLLNSVLKKNCLISFCTGDAAVAFLLPAQPSLLVN